MTSNNSSSSIRIAFIGGGNMAAAIIGGLINHNAKPDNILAIDPFPASRDNLSNTYKVRVAADCESASNFLATANLVIFAVKPQQFKEAAAQYKAAISSQLNINAVVPLVLSIAAGIRLENISKWVGSDRVVRAMPNTPALIGKGVTGLCSAQTLAKEDRQLIETACNAIGKFVWVDKESLIDSVTAVSGSGPAYVFAFLEALQAAGEAQGLSTEQAKVLALETLVGSAALAANSTDSPTTLREKVTSKGGTTFAALEVMREKSWGETLKQAVDAAAKRGEEMGREFGRD